jgi:hypothetical protein
MFQLFSTYVLSILFKYFKRKSGCCTCCNMTHPATTAYCNCLGAVHVCGGEEGWSASQQRTREAEGDGGRGAGSPCAACGCGKWRVRGRKWIGRGRLGRGTKWGCSFLGAAASGAEMNCSHGRPVVLMLAMRI